MCNGRPKQKNTKTVCSRSSLPCPGTPTRSTRASSSSAPPSTPSTSPQSSSAPEVNVKSLRSSHLDFLLFFPKYFSFHFLTDLLCRGEAEVPVQPHGPGAGGGGRLLLLRLPPGNPLRFFPFLCSIYFPNFLHFLRFSETVSPVSPVSPPSPSPWVFLQFLQFPSVFLQFTFVSPLEFI